MNAGCSCAGSWPAAGSTAPRVKPPASAAPPLRNPRRSGPVEPIGLSFAVDATRTSRSRRSRVYAPSPLLGAAGKSLRDHVDFVERTCARDIEDLLAGPAERDVLAVRRRASDGDGAEVPALCAEDFDAAAGGDVEPAVVVDGHAV